MGYDASVYLIYGIKINIHDRDEEQDDIFDIIDLLKPGYIDNHEDDDIKYIYGELDMEPNENGYFCFPVGNDFFVSCYVHKQVVIEADDDCLEVTLPNSTLISEFNEWLVKNNVNGTPKFYTKVNESC